MKKFLNAINTVNNALREKGYRYRKFNVNNVKEVCVQCVAEFLHTYGDSPENRATIISVLLWWESEDDDPFRNMVTEEQNGKGYAEYAYPSVLKKIKEGKSITVEVLCRYYEDDEEYSFNLDFEIVLPPIITSETSSAIMEEVNQFCLEEGINYLPLDEEASLNALRTKRSTFFFRNNGSLLYRAAFMTACCEYMEEKGEFYRIKLLEAPFQKLLTALYIGLLNGIEIIPLGTVEFISTCSVNGQEREISNERRW